MKVLLTSLNAKFIHTNLALRWLYVARDPSFDVKISEYTIRDNLIDVADKIANTQPDIVGLSVYIWNQDESKELVQLLIQRLPNLRIIVGGPEVSYEYQDWLKLPIQCVLRGEGEKTFWQACRNEEDIEGYVSRNRVSDIPYAKVNLGWLETLESPYTLEFDHETRQNRYLYFETSRGCPYRCSYCLSSLDNQVRMFSEDYVIKHLTHLNNESCKQVKFLDRTFNTNPSRALRIAQCIEQVDVSFSFQFEVVLDTMSEALMKFFCEADKKKFRFEVGVQSFNEKTLFAVNRSQDLNQLKKNIQRLSDAGCILHVDLIGGLPYENLDSFESSYTQLFQCRATEIQVGVLKLLKGTQLRKQADEFRFAYLESSPYTIQSTSWLSREDVQVIEDVYHATEKLYNTQRCRTTLDTVAGWGFPIFKVMAAIGLKMRSLNKQPQISDYFHMAFEVLHAYERVDSQLLEALLNTDYYGLFKQTPKPIFQDALEGDKIKHIFKKWITEKIFDEQTLYNYVKIRYGYTNQRIAIQALVYSSQQSLPTRIWFSTEGEPL